VVDGVTAPTSPQVLTSRSPIRRGAGALLGLGAFLVLAAPSPPAADGAWRSLAPGLDLRVLEARTASPVGDSTITVLRIDPEGWELVVVGMGRAGEPALRTAREWAQSHGLAAAINAGMFATDYATHVGYLRFRNHVNSPRVNDYRSVAAFDPLGSTGRPRFRIFDLDAPGVTMEGILADYGSAIQNLRLIRRPGTNRWSPQDRRWSEAALGEDREGRILFLFARSPFSMHDLNDELLRSGIGIVAAQHLEGGPEAQLYVRAGGRERELFGSWETAFREDDRNGAPWPVPIVLGVRPRAPAVPD
jgi:hypothetical protein